MRTSEQSERRARLRAAGVDICGIIGLIGEQDEVARFDEIAADINAELDSTEPLQWMDTPTEAGWYWVRFPGVPPFLSDDAGCYPTEPFDNGGRWLFCGPLKPPEVPDDQG